MAPSPGDHREERVRGPDRARYERVRRRACRPARPGMEHGEYADGPADPARIAGQHDDRRGGGLHKRAVAVDLGEPDLFSKSAQSYRRGFLQPRA